MTTNSPVSATDTLAWRLSHCSECGRPFARTITEEEWRKVFIAEEDVSYGCEDCSEEFASGGMSRA